MGLAGIFDPIVRAYFMGQPSSGETYNNGVVCLPFSGVSEENANELGVCMISDFAPSIEAIKASVYLKRSDDISIVSFSGADIVFELVNENGITFLTGNEKISGNTFVFVFPDDIAAEGMTFKKGTYVAPLASDGYVIFELA